MTDFLDPEQVAKTIEAAKAICAAWVKTGKDQQLVRYYEGCYIPNLQEIEHEFVKALAQLDHVEATEAYNSGKVWECARLLVAAREGLRQGRAARSVKVPSEKAMERARALLFSAWYRDEKPCMCSVDLAVIAEAIDAAVAEAIRLAKIEE